MKFTRQIRPILGLAATLCLAACGGGSSSNNSTGDGPVATGPTDVTAIGSITGFGSVFVNGAKYEIAADTIVAIEGEIETTGDDSKLRLGMKVRIIAIDDNGLRTARHIEFDEDLKGLIESISPDAGDPTIGSFSVMGQTVTVDAGTVFDDDVGNNDGVAGIDFRDLALGMVVEVSGFPNDDGILATRVDRELDAAGGDPDIGQPGIDGDELELKDFVESVASDNASITVGGVVFSINDSTIFEDGLILGPDLAGVFVEVKADIVAGEFVAVRVEREDDFDDDDRHGEFEVEGILQSVDTTSTPNTFTINGITVPVTDASSLEVLVGMRVEIKGSFNADLVLVLREAALDTEDNVRTEDLIATVDTAAVSFTTRLGLVINPTGASRVEDDTGSDDGDHLTPQQFIDRLTTGDRIESRGHENSDGSVSWTRVERDDLAENNKDFECELRGPVASIEGDAAAFSFVIQGVTVLTGRVTDDNFEGANDDPIGRAAFFDRLTVGDIVDVDSFEGDEFCMTGTLDAREVELESADGS
jgi:hypothetical protein